MIITIENKKEIEFIYFEEDSINEDLLCGICTNPLIDPIEHNSIGKGGCSQIYCKKCIKDQQKCPHCRNEVFWKDVENTPQSQRFLFKPLIILKLFVLFVKTIIIEMN